MPERDRHAKTGLGYVDGHQPERVIGEVRRNVGEQHQARSEAQVATGHPIGWQELHWHFTGGLHSVRTRKSGLPSDDPPPRWTVR